MGSSSPPSANAWCASRTVWCVGPSSVTIVIVDKSRIAAFPVLADLPAAEQDELAAVMNEVEIEAGARVITFDDFGHFIYFVEQGEADVLTDDGQLSQQLSQNALGPGDVFGELAVLVTEQRTATVVARTPMRLASLFDPDFQQIRARVPEFERSLRRIASERLSR